MVNRDIKLENTLLDQSRRPLIKICDFGYSKHLQKDSVPKSRVGTPGYTGARLPSVLAGYHIGFSVGATQQSSSKCQVHVGTVFLLLCMAVFLMLSMAWLGGLTS